MIQLYYLDFTVTQGKPVRVQGGRIRREQIMYQKKFFYKNVLR